MQLQTVHKRRPRNRAIRTTGILVRTEHDARGIAEPLERYGELPACQLVGLYNAIQGLPQSSAHTLARLKRLFHESEGLPASQKLLLRPEYQWRHGYNHQTIYRRTSGTGRLLLNAGIYETAAVRWANAARIVRIGDNGCQQPADHDAALSVAMSSIEIAIRRRSGLRFISHIEIIRNASGLAQQALNPLAIPVPTIEHTFPTGRCTELSDARIIPDATFGIRYPPTGDPDFRFFALEYDRGTEDVEPTGNLHRSSWLRKVLTYSAICSGIAPAYMAWLKIPNLLVLCLFCDSDRMAHVMRIAAEYAKDPRLFLFKTIAPIDPFLNARLLPELLYGPWQKIGGRFNLSTFEERR